MKPELLLGLVALAAGCSNAPVPTGSDAMTLSDGAAAVASLFPLAVGNTWTYSITGSCAGTVQNKVLSADPVGGRPAFQVSGCSVQVTYSTPTDGEVDVLVGDAWLVLVNPTLQEGHSWSYYTTTNTWHRETSVTVPAGTYDDCWTAVSNTSSYPTSTYCRGVGRVHIHDDAGDQLLTAFSVGS